jgi:hypothetical protein
MLHVGNFDSGEDRITPWGNGVEVYPALARRVAVAIGPTYPSRPSEHLMTTVSKHPARGRTLPLPRASLR